MLFRNIYPLKSELDSHASPYLDATATHLLIGGYLADAMRLKKMSKKTKT